MLSALTLRDDCDRVQHRVVDKPAYHHGDLRNALIAAALAAVEQDGPDAVSLRDLAQNLGVSRAAPYRHFEDRDALLAAVAARRFEVLQTSATRRRWSARAMARTSCGRQARSISTSPGSGQACSA